MAVYFIVIRLKLSLWNKDYIVVNIKLDHCSFIAPGAGMRVMKILLQRICT